MACTPRSSRRWPVTYCNVMTGYDTATTQHPTRPSSNFKLLMSGLLVCQPSAHVPPLSCTSLHPRNEATQDVSMLLYLLSLLSCSYLLILRAMIVFTATSGYKYHENLQVTIAESPSLLPCFVLEENVLLLDAILHCTNLSRQQPS